MILLLVGRDMCGPGRFGRSGAPPPNAEQPPRGDTTTTTTFGDSRVCAGDAPHMLTTSCNRYPGEKLMFRANLAKEWVFATLKVRSRVFRLSGLAGRRRRRESRAKHSVQQVKAATAVASLTVQQERALGSTTMVVQKQERAFLLCLDDSNLDSAVLSSDCSGITHSSAEESAWKHHHGGAEAGAGIPLSASTTAPRCIIPEQRL